MAYRPAPPYPDQSKIKTGSLWICGPMTPRQIFWDKVGMWSFVTVYLVLWAFVLAALAVNYR